MACANFDRHGVGSMTGVLIALLFAVLVIRLAWRILDTPPEPATGDGATVSLASRLIGAIVWLVLAAPTFTQLSYLSALPAALTMAIILSCCLRAFMTAGLWWFATRRADAGDFILDTGPSALLLALVIGVPKALLVVDSLHQSGRTRARGRTGPIHPRLPDSPTIT